MAVNERLLKKNWFMRKFEAIGPKFWDNLIYRLVDAFELKHRSFLNFATSSSSSDCNFLKLSQNSSCTAADDISQFLFDISDIATHKEHLNTIKNRVRRSGLPSYSRYNNYPHTIKNSCVCDRLASLLNIKSDAAHYCDLRPRQPNTWFISRDKAWIDGSRLSGSAALVWPWITKISKRAFASIICDKLKHISERVTINRSISLDTEMSFLSTSSITSPNCDSSIEEVIGKTNLLGHIPHFSNTLSYSNDTLGNNALYNHCSSGNFIAEEPKEAEILDRTNNSPREQIYPVKLPNLSPEYESSQRWQASIANSCNKPSNESSDSLSFEIIPTKSSNNQTFTDPEVYNEASATDQSCRPSSFFVCPSELSDLSDDSFSDRESSTCGEESSDESDWEDSDDLGSSGNCFSYDNDFESCFRSGLYLHKENETDRFSSFSECIASRVSGDLALKREDEDDDLVIFDRSEENSEQELTSDDEEEENETSVYQNERNSRLAEINSRWKSHYSTEIDGKEDCHQEKNPLISSTKKVTFHTGSDELVPILNEADWSDDYRQARVGPWTIFAADRERFRMRIANVEKDLGWVLSENHRAKIYDRLQSLNIV